MANLISIGQLIDKSWDHYASFFKQLMKISAWAFLIPTLVLIRMIFLPEGENAYLVYLMGGFGNTLMLIGLIFGVLASVIAIPAITMLIYINLVKVIEAQENKTAVSFADIRKYGWRTFFSYLWVAVLKTFFTTLPLLLIVPGIILIFTNLFYGGGAFWGAFSNLTMLFGLLGASILIVLLSIKLGFAGLERLIVNKKGMTAIKGSYSLVTGRFWKTFWRLFVAKIVFGIGVGLLHVISIMAIKGLEYALTPLSNFEETLSAGLSLYLDTGIIILTVPIFVIVDYIIYDSLRKTK